MGYLSKVLCDMRLCLFYELLCVPGNSNITRIGGLGQLPGLELLKSSNFTIGWLKSVLYQSITKCSQGVLGSMITMEDEPYFRSTVQNGFI